MTIKFRVSDQNRLTGGQIAANLGSKCRSSSRGALPTGCWMECLDTATHPKVVSPASVTCTDSMMRGYSDGTFSSQLTVPCKM